MCGRDLIRSRKDSKNYKTAARVILGSDVNHTITLGALGWEPLKIERKMAKGKMMYKILNKMGPQSLNNYHLRGISSSLCHSIGNRQ